MKEKPSSRFREIIMVFAKYGFGYIFDRKDEEQKKSPANLRKSFEDLGPTFIKIGQILSTRPDLLPKEYIDELVKLQDSAIVENFDDMKLVFEKSLNTTIDESFQYLNRAPIASASIAQVYEGILKDGREVVLKIQRPKIYEKIIKDIAILMKILKIAEGRINIPIIDPIEALEEIKFTTIQELDFISEAGNIEKFSELNKNTAPIYAPYVVRELLSDKVLVLENIDGIKINDIKELEQNGYNINDIADKLTLAFCKHIFEDGFFHGDPHPGNLLISEGKICFIDFGIVGQLSDNMKKWLNIAMIAIATHDKEKLVNCILAIAIKKGKVNKVDIYDSVSYIFDVYLETSIKNIKISELVQEIWNITRENNIQLPRELVSLTRSLILLEGVIAYLDPDLEIVNVIANFMKSNNRTTILRCLEKEELIISLYCFTRDSMKIPTKTIEVLNKLSDGKLTLDIRINEIDEIIKQANKMVNRLTEGVVIAALILSSSLIISNDVKPLYRGISIIGIGGYAIAFMLAIKVLISMSRANECRKKK
ncbi:AarF/UbiB family protein [Clostridium sp.]|uniref:ABC1 kinase family protein n=1 Tax=Clostridium sp. TaxID=1506 RepID=UPI00290F5F5C|nr:AarF/UbiB family protein [Clostridium sp.]MDU4846524.1 AarF/UbiB family protein [Clostridium sp.]